MGIKIKGQYTNGSIFDQSSIYQWPIFSGIIGVIEVKLLDTFIIIFVCCCCCWFSPCFQAVVSIRMGMKIKGQYMNGSIF